MPWIQVVNIKQRDTFLKYMREKVTDPKGSYEPEIVLIMND
jgi:hypothetical protein